MSDHGPADNRHTKAMASFVAGLKFEDIPDDVKHRAKLLILDSLGCGLYGARLEWTNILIDTLSAIDSDDDCRLLGSGKALSPLHAALVNGTQIQGFELDDVHRRGVLHVGAVTLPPLTAIADMNAGLTGREYLTAAIAGYEMGPRVGICMGQEHIGQGWHSGATLGVFSAAGGAARALGLDAEKTVHALGIAGTQAAGLMAAQFGAMIKRVHAGKSAHSGLLAALLAKNGMTGIVDVFEAPYGGFCSTFSRSNDRYNLEELSKGLGEDYELMNIALKFYSCVGSNHTTLDSIRDIQARRPFTLNDVAKIVVKGSQVTVDHVGWPYRPEGVTSAQLNLPYCVATLLLEDEVFVDQFSDDSCVTNPERMEVSKLVEVVHDPEITALGSKHRHKVHVEVHLKDGSVEKETREYARGSEHDFATEETILRKFKLLTRDAIPEQQTADLIDAIMTMEELPSAKRLVDLMTVA